MTFHAIVYLLCEAGTRLRNYYHDFDAWGAVTSDSLRQSLDVITLLRTDIPPLSTPRLDALLSKINNILAMHGEDIIVRAALYHYYARRKLPRNAILRVLRMNEQEEQRIQAVLAELLSGGDGHGDQEP